jgi:hypothetical protein
MPTFSPQEIYFAEDGQMDIALDHPYVVGSSMLMVFLNGMLAVIDEDYIEKDETTLSFQYQLSKDDVIIVQYQVYFDDIKISVINNTGKGLFDKYGDVDTLLKNQRYTLSFKYDEQVFEADFHTRLDPFYSTISRIKNDLGDVTEDIEDKRIMYMVYENSILSQNIASDENVDLLELEDKTPYVFKQFVRYRTELDIMTAVYMSLSGRQGSVKKQLGELTIDRKRNLGTTIIGPILQDLKDKLKEWEILLRGGSSSNVVSPVATAVRGGTSNPYPLTSPRRGE